MGYFAVATVIQNEDRYLPEWITYYRLMGASHFWLYDNDSKIPASKSTEKINHGDITVVPLPGRSAGRQVRAFTDAVLRARGKTTWLALIDVDEFIVPKKDPDICDLLKNYESFGALAINWQMFGSSGHKVRPICLQIEAYTKRKRVGTRVNRHVKVIVRPERVSKARCPHSVFTKKGFMTVNEKRAAVDGPFSLPVSTDIVQINHYFTRSLEEYRFKISKGDANGAVPKNMTQFYSIDRSSTETDTSAVGFASHVRAAFYNDRIKIK